MISSNQMWVFNGAMFNKAFTIGKIFSSTHIGGGGPSMLLGIHFMVIYVMFILQRMYLRISDTYQRMHICIRSNTIIQYKATPGPSGRKTL